MNTTNLQTNISVHLNIDKSTDVSMIELEDVKASLKMDHLKLEVSGLMELPDDVMSEMSSDIINHFIKRESKILSKNYEELINYKLEEIFGGMLLKEAFDFISELSEKAK